MRIFLLIAILSIAACSFAQYPEKVWFDKNDPTNGYYVSILPLSSRVQGVLILFNGYGGNADGFLSETKIHNVAWANDLLTICIPTGTRLFLDQSLTQLINKILQNTLTKYGLRKDQVVMGGISSGGTIALRYTELCAANPAGFPVLPKGVFAIDSPVDLVGLYKASERDLQKHNGGWWLGDCKLIIDKFKKELGDPYKDLTNYRAASPLLRESTDSTNEKFLSGIAVRTYHDVDINWYIQNRLRSLYEVNMLDGSELISRLVSLGNKHAEFIGSKNIGMRSNGQRHPNSWNLVDEIELVQWIKTILNFYPDHLAKPYEYTAPEGWGKELILLPFDFATGIAYKGFEELRFAPGWGNPTSPEKWAYTILWWLDGQYKFTESTLQDNIEIYFSGLTKRRAIADSTDMSGFQPAKAKVEKVKTDKGDLGTFTANASIFDAHVTKKPGNLFFKIHVKQCSDTLKTIVLFEVAGNPFTENVWSELDKINVNFKCVK